MLFLVLHIYNDPVFESKPYYINVDPVLVRRLRLWVQTYMHSVSYILGPHNIVKRPLLWYCIRYQLI